MSFIEKVILWLLLFAIGCFFAAGMGIPSTTAGFLMAAIGATLGTIIAQVV